MNRKTWTTLVLAALLPAIAVTAGALAQDKDKPKTIKDVMGKLHKGTKAQSGVLKGQLKADPIDWEAVQKTTKDFVILGADLAKNDPPKGDKESWKNFADKYFATAKELDDAATAKDKSKVEAAQKSMGASCKSCHDAHKGESK
ncbi:cytochrome c [Tundrisphaera sp. TA3]|uniref:cytochrome c n=1 Tax=Tundrisphaera sp. TA3 TaxID=3435775 RepID=UPI003EBDBFE4